MISSELPGSTTFGSRGLSSLFKTPFFSDSASSRCPLTCQWPSEYVTGRMDHSAAGASEPLMGYHELLIKSTWMHSGPSQDSESTASTWLTAIFIPNALQIEGVQWCFLTPQLICSVIFFFITPWGPLYAPFSRKTGFKSWDLHSRAVPYKPSASWDLSLGQW